MERLRSVISNLHTTEEINEGTLTSGYSEKLGLDTYDFGTRAALVRKTKEELGIPDSEPLPSPWTVEIEPTYDCNADCHFAHTKKRSKKQNKAKKKFIYQKRQSKIF